MTEQEKKDVIYLVRTVVCEDCYLQYGECAKRGAELYCEQLIEKLDREIVPKEME